MGEIELDDMISIFKYAVCNCKPINALNVKVIGYEIEQGLMVGINVTFNTYLSNLIDDSNIKLYTRFSLKVIYGAVVFKHEITRELCAELYQFAITNKKPVNLKRDEVIKKIKLHFDYERV